MAKTIKQIAENIGVTKQAVWQKIKRDKQLYGSLQQFMETINGTVYISSEGERIINDVYFDGINEDKHSNNLNDSAVNTLSSTLVNTVNILKEQLEAKDNQIVELQNIIKSLQEQQTILTKSLANSQALHAGTIKEHIDSKAEKSGLFGWILHLIMKK